MEMIFQGPDEWNFLDFNNVRPEDVPDVLDKFIAGMYYNFITVSMKSI